MTRSGAQVWNAKTWTRRAALGGALALGGCFYPAYRAGKRNIFTVESRVEALEAELGGRIGFHAHNLANDETISWRGEERFALCSTFKWMLGAAALDMLEDWDARVLFNESELLDYAPVTRARMGSGPAGLGEMSVLELAEAAVVVSDNTAANLLLEGLMGPEGFTHWLRAHGDGVTRLDRNEPSLNVVDPGDERDTTTPAAMTRTMRRLLVEDGLEPGARAKIIEWMIACSTGRERLRAGLPETWRVGDKTGSYPAQGSVNDVAIAWPREGAPPILIACYMQGGATDVAAKNAAHATLGRLVGEVWGTA